MRIGVSGASGKLGRLAVGAALACVAPSDLVLTTRTPESLAELAARGVTVRHADFDAPDSLSQAFAGIERLFMVSAANDTGKRFDQHDAAIKAAGRARVKHLVFTSMPNVDDPRHPVGMAAQEYHEAEVLLAASDVPCTILRNAPYAELHVVERLLPALQAGELRINSGAGAAAFMARSDIAEAAIAILLQDRHAGTTYDLTGPELLTYRQVAEIVSGVTRTPLDYVELEDAAFAHEGLAAGLSAPLVDTLTRIGTAIREGYFAVRTNVFRQVTGREPLSVGEVLDANRHVLLAAANTPRKFQ
jgi:NAD(P)H dehydrogenase (quinone)